MDVAGSGVMHLLDIGDANRVDSTALLRFDGRGGAFGVFACGGGSERVPNTARAGLEHIQYEF